MLWEHVVVGSSPTAETNSKAHRSGSVSRRTNYESCEGPSLLSEITLAKADDGRNRLRNSLLSVCFTIGRVV